MPDTLDTVSQLQPVMIGSDILGYSFSRAFYERYEGTKTLVLSAIDNKLTSSSAFCDYVIEPRIGEERYLLDYLVLLGERLERQGKRGLLVGCADWRARFLSKHKPELERWFFVPYIDFELLDQITQKSKFYALCDELGIAFPKTWELDCGPESTAPDAEAFSYPLIAKPSNSAAYEVAHIEGKEKVYELQDASELLAMWRAVKAGGYTYPMLLQDFIPGGDDALFSLTVYCAEGGKPQVISGGQVVLQDHSPLGIGNPVCILGAEKKEIIEPALSFLEHVGYRGYANFDIKYDARDGSYRFFEINTRMGRNSYYVSLGGVNFVEPIVDDFVLGQTPHEPIYAYNRFLYTVVPESVAAGYCDEELVQTVRAAYKDGWAKDPQMAPNDSFAHKFWTRLYLWRQKSKYRETLGVPRH